MYALNYTWGIWLLLFGIYFPEPLPPGARGRTFWRWVMWLVIVPLAFRVVFMVILSVGTLENYSSVFPLLHLVVQLNRLFAIASYAALIGCVLCLAWKWWTAKSIDARRRFRVVMFGALISFPLLQVLNLTARLRHLAFPDTRQRSATEQHRITGVGGSASLKSLTLPSLSFQLGGLDVALKPATVLLEANNGTSAWFEGNLGMDLLNEARRVDLDLGSMTLSLI